MGKAPVLRQVMADGQIWGKVLACPAQRDALERNIVLDVAGKQAVSPESGHQSWNSQIDP